jgi:hypothetical protein
MTRNDLPSRSTTKTAAVLGVLMILSNASLSNAITPSHGLPMDSSMTSCPTSMVDVKRADRFLQPSLDAGGVEEERKRESSYHPFQSGNDTIVTAAKHGRVRRATHGRLFQHESFGDSRRMRSRQTPGKTYSLVDSYEGSTFFE